MSDGADAIIDFIVAICTDDKQTMGAPVKTALVAEAKQDQPIAKSSSTRTSGCVRFDQNARISASTAMSKRFWIPLDPALPHLAEDRSGTRVQESSSPAKRRTPKVRWDGNANGKWTMNPAKICCNSSRRHVQPNCRSVAIERIELSARKQSTLFHQRLAQLGPGTDLPTPE